MENNFSLIPYPESETIRDNFLVPWKFMGTHILNVFSFGSHIYFFLVLKAVKSVLRSMHFGNNLRWQTKER